MIEDKAGRNATALITVKLPTRDMMARRDDPGKRDALRVKEESIKRLTLKPIISV